MGIGALLSDDLIPAAAKNPFNDPVTGPENIFVSLRPGSNRRVALRSLQQMTIPFSTNFNFGVFVVSVLRPAEIVNYRSMSTTPAILGLALGLGAVAALVLTLLAAVRRRRRRSTVAVTRKMTASHRDLRIRRVPIYLIFFATGPGPRRSYITENGDVRFQVALT